MLANLLPGVRQVRTPLTVGYLWLIAGWLWFADKIPRERPTRDGPVARLFDISEVAGASATFAALSFVAYVLGALLTFSTDRGVARRVLYSERLSSVDASQTFEQMQDLLRDHTQRILQRADALPPPEREIVEKDLARATRAGASDIKTRLLVANQEMYGEYDRLASEADFRLNLCPPVAAIGFTLAVETSVWWIPVTLVVVALLIYHGLVSRAESQVVILRAVLSNVIEHPVESLLKRVD